MGGMGVSCTIISISYAEVYDPAPDDLTLPHYDSELSSKVSQLERSQLLQLGPIWMELHDTWGSHPADHPLGFLAGGGNPVPALDEGEYSSGRYFDAETVIKILAAVHDAEREVRPGVARRLFKRARTANPEVQHVFEKIAKFLGETVAAGRGIIIHQFEGERFASAIALRRRFAVEAATAMTYAKLYGEEWRTPRRRGRQGQSDEM